MTPSRQLSPALGLFVALGLGALAACAPPYDDEPCSPGLQGCECRPPGAAVCNPGLVCSAINMCVPAGEGTDDGGDAASVGEPGSGDESGAGDGSADGGSGDGTPGDGTPGDSGGQGDSGGPGGGGSCSQPGQDCASNTCCDDSTCVNFDPNVECAADCSVGNDCTDCCCVGLQNGGAVCVGNFCQGDCGTGCSAVPSLCDVNGDCCEYFSGGAYCVNFPDIGGVCAASCTANSDCVSDCCLSLTGGGAACGPAELCGGAAPVPEPGELMRPAADRMPGAVVPAPVERVGGDEVEEFVVR